MADRTHLAGHRSQQLSCYPRDRKSHAPWFFFFFFFFNSLKKNYSKFVDFVTLFWWIKWQIFTGWQPDQANFMPRGWYRFIGQVGRVFANGARDLGSIPGRVIPKTFKMVLDTSLLNTQQYKVRIKGKVGAIQGKK